jgi:hypothetical protein
VAAARSLGVWRRVRRVRAGQCSGPAPSNTNRGLLVALPLVLVLVLVVVLIGDTRAFLQSLQCCSVVNSCGCKIIGRIV